MARDHIQDPQKRRHPRPFDPANDEAQQADLTQSGSLDPQMNRPKQTQSKPVTDFEAEESANDPDRDDLDDMDVERP